MLVQLKFNSNAEVRFLHSGTAKAAVPPVQMTALLGAEGTNFTFGEVSIRPTSKL
jgi:hypothetical protein